MQVVTAMPISVGILGRCRRVGPVVGRVLLDLGHLDTQVLHRQDGLSSHRKTIKYMLISCLRGCKFLSYGRRRGKKRLVT
jgi:hypothetical protein